MYAKKQSATKNDRKILFIIKFTDGKCTACGVDDPNYVPRHTHDYEAVVTAPTCTADGFTTYTCSVYNASRVGDVVSLAGVYDICDKRMSAAKDMGIHTYSSLEDILNDSSVDIVLYATPNDVHKDIVLSSLLAGKNVICEKPAALSVAEFDEMLAAEKKSGKLLSVHQNRRWDVDFLTIKNIIESGEIGETLNIESRIHGSRGIPSDWRCHKPYGGGMIYDWGVHLIDQMLTLIPEQVTGVF